MAYYTTRDENRLIVLKSTKRSLYDLLEYAIKLAVLERGIYQVCFIIELDSKLVLRAYLTDNLVSMPSYLQNIYRRK